MEEIERELLEATELKYQGKIRQKQCTRWLTPSTN